MTYYLSGLILILLGSSHMFAKIDPMESSIVEYIQGLSKHEPLLTFFKDIWFFGKTTFSIILLTFLILFNWKTGLIAAGVFLVFIGIEYLLKTLYFRKRPYIVLPAISMLQPLEPLDSSFPSGDSLRVWNLALLAPAALQLNTSILAGAIFLAILVTVGRMVMGVHYLTDTLAGAGLGILCAGTTLWLWNLLNII